MEDRRADKRTAIALKVKLKYPDLDAFVERYSKNISKSGIFITSKKPKPEGTTIKFELLLADGSKALRGVGRVKWVKPYDPEAPKKPHGMGIRFTKLDKESKEIVERMIEAKEAAKARKGAPKSENKRHDEKKRASGAQDIPKDQASAVSEPGEPAGPQPEPQDQVSPEQAEPQDQDQAQPEPHDQNQAQPEQQDQNQAQPEPQDQDQAQPEQAEQLVPQDQDQAQPKQPEQVVPQDRLPPKPHDQNQAQPEQHDQNQAQPEQPEPHDQNQAQPEQPEPHDQNQAQPEQQDQREGLKQPVEIEETTSSDQSADGTAEQTSSIDELDALLGDRQDDLVASALRTIKRSNILDDEDLEALLSEPPGRETKTATSQGDITPGEEDEQGQHTNEIEPEPEQATNDIKAEVIEPPLGEDLDAPTAGLQKDADSDAWMDSDNKSDDWPDVTLPNQRPPDKESVESDAGPQDPLESTEPLDISQDIVREGETETLDESPSNWPPENTAPTGPVAEEVVDRLNSDELVVLDDVDGLEELIVDESPLDVVEEDYRGEPIIPKPPTPPPLRDEGGLNEFEELSREHTGRVLEPPAVAQLGTESSPGIAEPGLGPDDRAVESDLSMAFENIRTDVRAMSGESIQSEDEAENEEEEEHPEPASLDEQAELIDTKDESDSHSQSSTVGFVWELGDLPQVERKVDVPQFDFDWDAKTNPNAGEPKSDHGQQPVAEMGGSEALSPPAGESNQDPPARDETQVPQDKVETKTSANLNDLDEDSATGKPANKKKKKGLFKRIFRK